MTSHEVAKILLGKPDAPLVIGKMSLGANYYLEEVGSVAWTNCGHFMDKNGLVGDEYNSGRECVEIK